MTLTNEQIDEATEQFDKIKNTFVLKPKEASDWCITNIKTILTALEMAKGNGWQSIDSVPKDGTEILILDISKDVYTAWFVENRERWEEAYSGDELIHKLTHWQPLPTPPKESE